MSNGSPAQTSRLPFPYDQEVDANEHLEAAVLNALHWDPTVPLAGLVVKVERGYVTLSGVVKTASQRESAEANARAVPKVVDVVNDITVQA